MVWNQALSSASQILVLWARLRTVDPGLAALMLLLGQWAIRLVLRSCELRLLPRIGALLGTMQQPI